MKSIIQLISLLILSSCVKTNRGQAILDVTNSNVGTGNLSELLLDYKIIPLETNNDCIIGDMSKYICAYDYIYVSSSNEILKFDLDGNFCGKLTRVGNGPTEYLKINDFEVIMRQDKVEILVAHPRGITRYDASSFDYIDETFIPYSVLQFKYITDNSIIIVTPNDYTFYLTDLYGNLRQPTVKNDPANLSHQLVQFTEIDGNIYYLICGTDEALQYDILTDQISVVKFVNGVENVLTRKNNIRYMRQYGYVQQPQRTQEDFTTIVTAQQCNNRTLLFTRSATEEKMWIRNDNTGEWKDYLIFPDPEVINDIFENVPLRYLITMVSNYSYNSFMQIIPAEILEGLNINNRQIRIDDNPVIMAYYIR